MAKHVGDPFLLHRKKKASAIDEQKRKQVKYHPYQPEGSFRDPKIKEGI